MIKKQGRPRGSTKLKPTDEVLKHIKSLARLQCTQPEAASFMEVSLATFERLLRDHEKAREAWNSGREYGKVSLRRMQWKAAERSTAMLIFLGKQYLGQTDKIEEQVKAKVETNATVAHVEMPDVRSVTDKREALRIFEEFRQNLKTQGNA
jgi:hypothetical protein